MSGETMTLSQGSLLKMQETNNTLFKNISGFRQITLDHTAPPHPLHFFPGWSHCWETFDWELGPDDAAGDDIWLGACLNDALSLQTESITL